jgi:hypothetical protein
MVDFMGGKGCPEGLSSQGEKCNAEDNAEGSVQAQETPPRLKNKLIGKSSVTTYHPIKAIRTDTTLDLSQKAEKSDW